LVPPGLERSLYVWLASLLLIVVCASWRPIPGVAWHIDGALAWPLYAMQLAGIWLSLRSAAIIDVGELAGLKAANVRDAAFEPTGPYGWVRHPIYAGWFLMVFAVPVMTFTRLEFALISAAYILIAIPLEERTLRATAGESYAKYSALVRWKVVPGVY
jgi:protein-S-isoprenylcysteine O-methyltransferase Ste14